MKAPLSPIRLAIYNRDLANACTLYQECRDLQASLNGDISTLREQYVRLQIFESSLLEELNRRTRKREIVHSFNRTLRDIQSVDDLVSFPLPIENCTFSDDDQLKIRNLVDKRDRDETPTAADWDVFGTGRAAVALNIAAHHQILKNYKKEAQSAYDQYAKQHEQQQDAYEQHNVVLQATLAKTRHRRCNSTSLAENLMANRSGGIKRSNSYTDLVSASEQDQAVIVSL